MPLKRIRNLGIETVVALIGTALSAMLLVVAAMNAGPLWRDETNTYNLAHMASLGDIWRNLQFDSCPLLWPVLVRACGMLGLANSDFGIRILGLGVGLLCLASLWLCQRWMGGRAPILSIALIGGLPAFVFIVGANRAYGLGCCLLVLTFGTVWRILQSPTRSRIIAAGLMCLLFIQCIYYDVVFLGAIVSAGGAVAFRRQQWKALWALGGIGLLSAASLLIYFPSIDPSLEVSFARSPFFGAATLWNGLRGAVSARSSADRGGVTGPQIWIWIGLVSAGIIAAILLQGRRAQQTSTPEAAVNSTNQRSDRALFCVASLVLGIIGYTAFLLKVQFFMPPWYYMEILVLCAVCLDGIFTASWPAFRPWGLIRIVFLAEMMLLNARPAWAEAHTRRSNVDVVADFLSRSASAGDLIVVQDAWEGITFNRYYRGQCQWLTVPPTDSHDLHRVDLVMAQMNQPDVMTPVLHAITNTLASGHDVWLVGSIPIARPQGRGPTPLPPQPSEMPTRWWYGSYLQWWNHQITTALWEHAQQGNLETIAVPNPVSHWEDVSVVRFSGYKPGPE